MSNFEWLLKEAMVDAAVPATPMFVVDDENWRGTIEQVVLAPSLRVFLNDLEIHRDLRIEPTSQPQKQYIVSQVAIEGDVDLDFSGGLRLQGSTDSAVLYRPVGPPPTYVFKPASYYRAAGYTVQFDRIERLFDGEVPAALRPLIDREARQDRGLTMRSGSTMRQLASRLFAREFNGALRRLTMEGVVLQLLAAQAMAADSAARPSRGRRPSLSSGEQAAVRQARERLLSDMRRPPSLAELADAVGLTERRLNAGFRQLYGATVFDVLRDQRLEHARQALKADAVSLKEVSFRVGYSHVSSFVNAFHARFGAPPRQYLRGDG
ncbi:MAG: helix-turn-helix transcriptional regulator [Rhodospirillales bacterium]|nr:helix-turn-helix transcriptional regulator [Rhodospirillales bacterium]